VPKYLPFFAAPPPGVIENFLFGCKYVMTASGFLQFSGFKALITAQTRFNH
jgi:hypothetical protein